MANRKTRRKGPAAAPAAGKSMKMGTDELKDIIKSAVKEAMGDEESTEDTPLEGVTAGDVLAVVEQAIAAADEKRKARKDAGEDVGDLTSDEVIEEAAALLAEMAPADDLDDPEGEWMYMLVESVTIPERSFIRTSYDTGKSTLEDICKDAVDGIIRHQWTAEQAMDFVGKWALEMTRGYFNTKLTPPKSATTQLTSTQYQPLFDTGRLFRSIVYRVEGGGGA